MTDHTARATPTGAEAPSDLVDPLLRAFQTMQMQTALASSQMATTLGISAIDLRGLLFVATGENVTPKRLGDFLNLTSGAITSLIDRMATAGYVERAPNPNDRRSLVVRLAPGGTGAVERVVEFYRRAFASSVPPQHVALLTTSFQTLGDSLLDTAALDLPAD